MFVLLTTILLIILTYEVETNIKVLDSGVLNLKKHSVGLQFFVDLENESRTNSCRVYSWCKQCCFTEPQKPELKNCGDMDGSEINLDLIPSRDRHTLTFVYPTIIQYNQIGFCDFIIDYNCSENNRHRKRYSLNVPFDTIIKKSKHPGLIARVCSSIDQDPFMECEPINCDWKYNGLRPHFDTTTQRCVSAPECFGKKKNNLPTIVYVPYSNICRNLNINFTLEDTSALKESAKLVNTTEKKVVGVYDNLISQLGRNKDTILCLVNGKTSCRSAINRLDVITFVSTIAFCGMLMLLVMCCLYSVCSARSELGNDVKTDMMRYRKRRKSSRYSNEEDGETDRLLETQKREKDRLVKELMSKNVPEVRSSVIDVCHALKDDKSGLQYRLSDSSLEDFEPNDYYTSSTSSLDDAEKELIENK